MLPSAKKVSMASKEAPGLPGTGVTAQAFDEPAHRSVVLKRFGFLVGPATASSHHAIRCEHFDLSTQWILDDLLEWPEGACCSSDRSTSPV